MHGLKSTDSVWYEFANGCVGFDTNAMVRHIPDCTGWDYEIPPEEKVEPAHIPFDGAGWYRTVGGKCLELSRGRSSTHSSGMVGENERVQNGERWFWCLDGTIDGVTPANNEPIEDWYLAEKLDGPPPELPAGYEHLHPPEFRQPQKSDLYIHAGTGEVNDSHGLHEPGDYRWIIRKSEPAPKTITLNQWRYRDEFGWALTHYTETIDWLDRSTFDESTLKIIDSREIEVPA